MTTALPSLPDHAWQEWLDVAADDAKGEAGEHDQDRLRHPANLVRWLRALSALDSDVNARIADGRIRLKAAKPLPNPGPDGDPAMKAWHDLRREEEDRHASRVRFRQAINDRLIECRQALADAGIAERLTQESLLQHIARAAALLDDDDVDAAEGLLRSVLAQAEAVL